MLSSSERQRGNISVLVKKRKMGHDMDFNDSGVPMDGVELDSSTVSRSGTSPHSQVSASTTNPVQNNNSEAKNIDRLMNDNEAIASETPYYSSYCEDTKYSGNHSPGRGSTIKLPLNSSSSQEGKNLRNNGHQDLGQGSIQSQNNPDLLRSFGDLFDDDDLD